MVICMDGWYRAHARSPVPFCPARPRPRRTPYPIWLQEARGGHHRRAVSSLHPAIPSLLVLVVRTRYLDGALDTTAYCLRASSIDSRSPNPSSRFHSHLDSILILIPIISLIPSRLFRRSRKRATAGQQPCPATLKASIRVGFATRTYMQRLALASTLHSLKIRSSNGLTLTLARNGTPASRLPLTSHYRSDVSTSRQLRPSAG